MTLETRNVAIQDTYGERFQHCWGCGPKNDLGLHLKTYPSLEGTSCISRIKVDQQYTGGVPANLFGGMIAVILTVMEQRLLHGSLIIKRVWN